MDKAMLDRMIVFATQKHAGQFDKGGNPYILHPLAVMSMLNTSDVELMCIALGHDLVEDCGVTYQELREKGMSERVIEGIRCLTKVPGATYDDYKNMVKSNSDAIKVKICDLRHNTDIRRLKGVSDRDMNRMQRYFVFYVELNSLLNENPDA